MKASPEMKHIVPVQFGQLADRGIDCARDCETILIARLAVTHTRNHVQSSVITSRYIRDLPRLFPSPCGDHVSLPDTPTCQDSVERKPGDQLTVSRKSKEGRHALQVH